ncbi:hypothetical protein QQF64_013601 [Cirrhinus molitorella]|uniref:Uncharacterized protein n=1 Tax=Cirrhinus molitorella TaxID=172907 RepID=A0ABR3LSW9_9TELE
MAAMPESHHVTTVTKVSPKIFLGGGYSTQAPADAELGQRLKRLISSMMDPHLMSARAAGIIPTSMLSEVLQPSAALPVMAVAILP